MSCFGAAWWGGCRVMSWGHTTAPQLASHMSQAQISPASESQTTILNRESAHTVYLEVPGTDLVVARTTIRLDMLHVLHFTRVHSRYTCTLDC